MKVKFNLSCFDIDTAQKEIVDYHGSTLVTSAIESILSLIASKYLYNEFETVEINHKKFANINSNYRKYLNYLRDKEIILINEAYEKGIHPKSYLFTDHFKEYATVKCFKSEPNDSLMDDGTQTNIDMMVRERIEQDFRVVKIKAEQVEKETRFVKDGQQIVKFRNYLLNEYSLYRLRNTPRVMHWRSGRLYTPFVQLSKDVRREYLFFDTKLISLDIKRSFPLWLVVWLIEKGVTLDYTTNEFITSVLSGGIYIDLMERFNNNKNLFNNTALDKPFINKDDVKKQFGIWLNGNNDINNLSNLIFKTYYPGIFDFVKKYKNGVKDRMYMELVTLETGFIFNHVCKRLYQEIPGVHLLTCHDEIYFEERYYEQVITIWNEELEKVYNNIPVKGELDIDFEESDLESLGIYVS